MSSEDTGRGEPEVNAFGLQVRQDAEGWAVMELVDGEWRVVSRHASEELARAASRSINESANRGTPARQHDASEQ